MDTDWVAIVALVLSVTTATVQGVSAWRRRPRVVVTVRPQYRGFPEGNPVRIVTRMYPTVVVRSLGGPIGVEAIELEWVPKSAQPASGYTMNVPESLAGTFNATRKSARLADGTRHLADDLDEAPATLILQDGGAHQWELRITAADGSSFPDPQRLRASVTLTSGKVHYSEPFTLSPDVVGTP